MVTIGGAGDILEIFKGLKTYPNKNAMLAGINHYYLYFLFVTTRIIIIDTVNSIRYKIKSDQRECT